MFDTGSSDLWIPTTLCTVPGCTSHRRFNPAESSTFQNLSTGWEAEFGTGNGVDPTQTWSASGFAGKDALNVGGLRIPDQTIAFVTNQTIFWQSDAFDGVLGMGYSSNTVTKSTAFFQNLIDDDLVAEGTYGFYLSPEDVGHAELTLGGVDYGRMTGPLRPIPVDITFPPQFPGHFTANFTDIIVNNGSTHIVGQAIIDTGTANIVAPTNDVAADFYQSVSPRIQLVNTAGIFAVPCNEIQDIPAEITFDFAGVRLTVPSSQLSVGRLPAGEATTGIYQGRDDLCQTVVNGGGLATVAPSLTELWVVGGSVMKFYYFAFEYANASLSVATTVQSPQ